MPTTSTARLLRRVRDLGDQVCARWFATNFNETTFAEIATECLLESDFSEKIELRDLFRILLQEKHSQPTHAFSDLAIRLYETPEFFIELLCWINGSNAIHEHPFSGAFHVLEGSGVHARYNFEPTEVISKRFQIGECSISESEILRKGMTRSIMPGAETLHSLYHVEQPSLTLVIRGHRENWHTPQMAVDRPHVAFDYEYYTDRQVEFCVSALNTAYAVSEDQAKLMLIDAVSSLDLARVYVVCARLDVWDYVTSGDMRELLESRFGQLGSKIVDSILYRRRLQVLHRHRLAEKEPQRRLFIGLLAVIESKSHIDSLLGEISDPRANLRKFVEFLLSYMAADSTDTTEDYALKVEVLYSVIREGVDGGLAAAERAFIAQGRSLRKEAFASAYAELLQDPVAGRLLS